MRIFSSGCQKKGPEGKERRYPEAGESRGVAQTGCYVALRANIKHSKNSALCLFGELTLVLINRGGGLVPPVNFGCSKGSPEKEVVMYLPLHSSAILTGYLLLGGAFGVTGLNPLKNEGMGP